MEVKVSAHSRIIYTFPSRPEGAAIVYARCSVRVPSTYRGDIKSFTLSLVGSESISFPSGALERSETLKLEKELPLPSPGQTVQYERSFFIPHTSAACQHAKLGRNFIKVKAEVKTGSWFGKTFKAEQRIFLVECKSEDPEELLFYDKRVQRLVDKIGPFELQVRSHLFVVGGYVRVALNLLGPEEKFKMIAFRGRVLQHCSVFSRRDRPGTQEKASVERLQFLQVKQEEMSSSGLEAVARLPQDSEMRPSTVEGSDAAIEFSHELEFEIDFIDGQLVQDEQVERDGVSAVSVEGQRLKRFKLRWPVSISSCLCAWDSMTLPAYAFHDPLPEATRSSGPESGELPCTCTEQNLETLLRAETKMLSPSSEVSMLESLQSRDSGYEERQMPDKTPAQPNLT